MSVTGPDVLERVYRKLGDNPDDPLVDSVQIQDYIMQSVREIASPVRLGVGPVWVENILTVPAGDRDLTFPTTVNGVANVEYGRIIALRYHGTNLPLRRVSRDELDAGRALGNTATGRQYAYTLWEGPDQVVNLQFPGYPVQAESLDAFVDLIPEDWAVGATTPPTIPFSKRAEDALVLMSACKVGQPLNPDKLNALRLDQRTFDRWEADCNRILDQELVRICSLKMTHGPRNFAWVAGWVV